MADTKRELLALLDESVFDPALRADANQYPADKRADLADVQHTARDTQRSYHRYGSSQHIVSMFEDDLRSPYGARETRKLHDLGLPAFPDVKDEFMRIAGKDRSGGTR